MTIIRYRNYVASAFAAVLLCGVASAAPGLTTPEPVGPFLDGAFPSTSPGTSPDGALVQENYYPGLTFIEPLRILQHPVEDRLVVVGKDGKGWTVKHAPGATDKQLFFDISSIMHGKSDIGEGGISDLVFHPEFGQNGSPNTAYVYISYRFSPGKGGTFDDNPTIDGYNRVSRFSVVNGQVDLSTELVLISQFDREQWHIGMDMEFGKDGFLYISVGDEGNCCDRMLSTQRLDGGLWSGILRIDVNQDPTRSHAIRRQPTNLAKDPAVNGAAWPASHTQGYSIPNDNPFVDKNGGNLEEFYSIGLRHPWTISFDKATGNLWVGDVGQSDREEVDLVRKGDNHQWGFLEGTIPGPIKRPATVIGNEVPPVFEYDHAIGKAVIGGGVYRGDQFPELLGKYLFSDFLTGILWTATPQAAAYKIDKIGEVTSGFPNGINSYLMDTKGNIMLARSKGALQPGSIERLVHKADVVAAPEPPALLSQTGAFADLATLKPRAGCIPYELIVPFWSDGAKKTRWMCVPNDGSHDTAAEQVTITPEGDWQFPVGSVLVKHFNLLMNESDPQSAVRVETRFLVQGVDRHYGVTYRWKPDGSDAELLKSGADIDFNIQSAAGPRKQTWHIPGRNQCQTCHGAATISALGLKSRQLNRDAFYPSSGLMGNQLETLNALGIVKVDVPNLATLLTSTRTDDCTAPIEARARSYIDSNCAYCHRPNGVRANFDARLTTPLADSKIVDGGLTDSLGIVGEAVVVAGGLEQSVAYLRANSVKEGFLMPPLGKTIVDQPGMSVVNAWIGFLKSGDPNAGKDLCLKDPEGATTGGSGGSGGSSGPGGSAGQLPSGSGGVGSPQAGNGPLGAAGSVAGRDGGCACVIAPLSQRSPWASLLAALGATAVVALRRRASRRPSGEASQNGVPLQHLMTRKQRAALGVVSLSVAVLAGACGASPGGDPPVAQSTAGSPGSVGGGGSATGGVPSTMMGGTAGTAPVNSTAGGGTSGGTGGTITGGTGTGGNGTSGTGGSGGMANPGAKPKILFVSGANHHNWLVQDPYLINILKWSKLFESVEYMVMPAASDDASWAAWRPKWTDYDVVVHNLDLFHSNFGRDWPDQVKKDFEAYMQNGGGLATLHAGTHGWENWDEYNKMTGGGWRGPNFGCSLEIVGGKQTIVPAGVGPAAADVPFSDQLVRVLDPLNPITKGLPAAWKIITDNSSVYQRGPCNTVTVLDYAYSKTGGGIDGYFPVSWTNQYHQGRFFFIAPMHVMANSPGGVLHEADDVGFQTMWIRGVEWAATNKVTYPVPDNFPTEAAVSRNDLSNFKAQ